MKKIILVLAVAMLLAVTNPTTEDFMDWVGVKLQQQSNNQLETLVSKALGKPLINVATSKQDYVLFSVFSIDLPGQDPIHIVGVLKQFINLSDVDLKAEAN